MKVSINQVIEKPELLNHNDCWSFYDWFCKDSTLERRAKAVLPKLKFLVKEGIINGNTHYMWLKNNCPMSGSTYDDIRISTLDAQDFVGGFCPRSGHDSAIMKCNVWTLGANHSMKDYEFVNWNAFKKHVKENEEFKKTLQATFNLG